MKPLPRRNPWYRIPGLILLVCAGAGTLTGQFLERFWWGFELTAHFRVQYALLLLAALILLTLGRRPVAAVAALLLCLMNAVVIAPYLVPQVSYESMRAPHSEEGMPLRIVFANLHRNNPDVDSAAARLARLRPDILVAAEVGRNGMDALRRHLPSMTVAVSEPRDDFFGIALFSRVPVQNARVEHLGEGRLPFVAGEIGDGPGRKAVIVGVHVLPPVDARHSALRNRQIDEIAEYVAGISAPVILTGDFNMTPWSYKFDELSTATGLTDARLYGGFLPTWPTWFLPLRIPIDHCLVTPGAIEVQDIAVGPDVASDHFPLITDLVLR